jgi:hypothetical protein
MINRILLGIVILVFIFSCSNLDSVSPEKRSTFIHYYGGPNNYSATDALEVSDGFVMVGNLTEGVDGSDGSAIVFIKTDLFGRELFRNTINNASANGVKALPNGGYLIIGDSMKFDKSQSLVIDQIVHKMRLISIDVSGKIILDRSWGRLDLDATNRVDLRGSAVTFDSNGDIITTSTINRPKLAVNQAAQLALHDPATLQIKWSQVYDQDKKDYVNSKSVHYDGANIIWATSSILSGPTTSYSFVRVPVFKDADVYSTFVNGSSFGENADKFYYSGSDIQPNAVGYGVIGTSRTYQGNNSNLFFLRLLPDGTPISGSEVYLDGPTLAKSSKPLTNNTDVGLSQDEGIVLASSSDGGFLLAGTTVSTADGTWGNGGKDLFLIKLSPFSTILWYKTFGGTGDEMPSSVKQTSDGGYLISGTLNLKGQSSIFLLKTDNNGELRN